MLFNSFEFAIFLPAVFLLYWFVVNKNLKAQNLLIVAVSYLFYGWWDWRFLLLIALTTACSYASGLMMQGTENQQIPPHAKIEPNTLLRLTLSSI